MPTEQAPNATAIRVERIAGRECVVISAVADPRICNILTPRDPEYPALLARAGRARDLAW